MDVFYLVCARPVHISAAGEKFRGTERFLPYFDGVQYYTSYAQLWGHYFGPSPHFMHAYNTIVGGWMRNNMKLCGETKVPGKLFKKPKGMR